MRGLVTFVAAGWATGLALSGCSDDPGGFGGLAELSATPGFAVVQTDYQSTAIAMLDPDGDVLDDAWITSGTTVPGLVTTLSGDVVLASGSGPDGALTILDRFNTDVMTRVRIPSGDIVGQLRTQTEIDWSSNPQDVLITGASEAWVSRLEPNPDPGSPLESGSDLVGFDPITMTLDGRRRSWPDVTVQGEVVPPRPSALVQRGDVVLVGLARLSVDFQTAAPGQVGVVVEAEPGTRAVDLSEGLVNCGSVQAVPGTTDRILVACIGLLSDPRPGAGLVELRWTGDDLAIEALWRPRDDAARPLAVSSATSLGPGRAVAVASGDLLAGTEDVLYFVDLRTGSVREVTRSREAFELGGSTFDEATGRLLVPDASEGVEIFRVDGDAFTPIGVVLDAPSTGLPVRSVVPL